MKKLMKVIVVATLLFTTSGVSMGAKTIHKSQRNAQPNTAVTVVSGEDPNYCIAAVANTGGSGDVLASSLYDSNGDANHSGGFTWGTPGGTNYATRNTFYSSGSATASCESFDGGFGHTKNISHPTEMLTVRYIWTV